MHTTSANVGASGEEMLPRMAPTKSLTFRFPKDLRWRLDHYMAELAARADGMPPTFTKVVVTLLHKGLDAAGVPKAPPDIPDED